MFVLTCSHINPKIVSSKLSALQIFKLHTVTAGNVSACIYSLSLSFSLTHLHSLTLSQPLTFTFIHSYYSHVIVLLPASIQHIYDVTTSYLSFPAAVLAKKLAIDHNTTVANIYDNYLALNIYYQSQNTDIEETVNAYSATALLSDIRPIPGYECHLNARIWYMATG